MDQHHCKTTSWCSYALISIFVCFMCSTLPQSEPRFEWVFAWKTFFQENLLIPRLRTRRNSCAAFNFKLTVCAPHSQKTLDRESAYAECSVCNAMNVFPILIRNAPIYNYIYLEYNIGVHRIPTHNLRWKKNVFSKTRAFNKIIVEWVVNGLSYGIRLKKKVE